MEQTDLSVLKTGVTVLNNVSDLERKYGENINPDPAITHEIKYGSGDHKTGIIIGIQVNNIFVFVSCRLLILTHLKVACGAVGGLLSTLEILGTHTESWLLMGAFFLSGFFLVSNYFGAHDYIREKCPKLKIFVRT